MSGRLTARGGLATVVAFALMAGSAGAESEGVRWPPSIEDLAPLFFQVDEASVGTPLNADIDVDDDILMLWDPASGDVVSSQQTVVDFLVVDGVAVATQAYESAYLFDRTRRVVGLGMILDRLVGVVSQGWVVGTRASDLVVVDPVTAETRSIAFEGDPFVVGHWIVDRVAGGGGIVSIRIIDPSDGAVRVIEPFMVGLDPIVTTDPYPSYSGQVGTSVVDDHVVFLAAEGTNGDLNKDGDTDDSVFYLLDAADATFEPLGLTVGPPPCLRCPWIFSVATERHVVLLTDAGHRLYDPDRRSTVDLPDGYTLSVVLGPPYVYEAEVRFAVHSQDGSVAVFDPSTGSVLATPLRILRTAVGPWLVGWSTVPDQPEDEWSLTLVHALSGEVVHGILAEDVVLESMQMFGDRIASVRNDGTLVILDPMTGRTFEPGLSIPNGGVIGPSTFAIVQSSVSDAVTSRPDASFPVYDGRPLPGAIQLVRSDVDGDGDIDVRVYLFAPPVRGGREVGLVDPSQGRWFLSNSEGVVSSFFFGNPGDVPFMGDWDGDGVDTPGMYRQSDGFVYLRNSNTQGVADISFFFGNPGDVPIVGDWDGDGFDTVSVYRPSESRVFVMNELGADGGGLGAAEFDFVFGNPGDSPFVGDFDGDGVDTVGLYRESTGYAYLRNALTTGVAELEFFFGDPGDRFVAGDWNGDGMDSPGVFRPGTETMYFRFVNGPGVADATMSWGEAHYLPVSGTFGLG